MPQSSCFGWGFLLPKNESKMRTRISTAKVNGHFVPVTTTVCRGLWTDIKKGVNVKDMKSAETPEERAKRLRRRQYLTIGAKAYKERVGL